jgi:enterobactin synthetase component D / holo-[acyl-carrier protein] synthase
MMLEELLPDEVIAVETRADSQDTVLFPAEEAALGQAVEKRRREYTTARACARAAFARLGLPVVAVTSGERGEPQWPGGVVGSITHCESYRACAIARSHEIVTVGVDAEPNAPLPAGVLPEIAGPEELRWLRELQHVEPAVCWDRLLFSAKESVYKAWFPLAKQWLGFEDAVVTIGLAERTFSARLLVSGPLLDDRRLTGFSGRWLVRDGLVLSAIALAA